MADAAPAAAPAAVPPAAPDPLDYSDRYNTPLSASQGAQFDQWAARQRELTGRDVTRDLYDYDLKGWWKNAGGENAPDLTGGHLTDTYKKPNHPTFSTGSQYSGQDGNEGGTWTRGDKGTYTFTPGKTNLELRSRDELQNYWDRVEAPAGNTLTIGPQPSRSRKRNWYKSRE